MTFEHKDIEWIETNVICRASLENKFPQYSLKSYLFKILYQLELIVAVWLYPELADKIV